MAANRPGFASLAVFAVFLLFCSIPTSTASSELLSKNYGQIAQTFGFPFPKLPNISFANVGKQCKETVEKLITAKLIYPCEYYCNMKTFYHFTGLCSKGARVPQATNLILPLGNQIILFLSFCWVPWISYSLEPLSPL